ncbi:MAG: alanine--tRNA ligase-related protein [archaeon]
MKRKELIKKYIEYFEKNGHKKIPNVSLIPQNDPTVLFTTAGMHPLVPYLSGQKHPQGKRLVGIQKCIRTGDIDAVGDTTHHTFFEMLGNWSLGDYWKKEAIQMSYEFLTKELNLNPKNLAVSVFKGDRNASKDEKSSSLWQSQGIPKERIAYLPKEDNWWGPAGNVGPCGPDTEMFYWKNKTKKAPKEFNPKDENWVEIWNDVLMQYTQDKRLILVDGMNTIYDKEFILNKEFMEMINSFNTHTVLTVNGFREKGKDLVKKFDPGRNSNWEAFSLEEKGIKKDNPEFFKILMKTFDLVPEEIIYFDHKKENVDVAKKLGILSKHYTIINSIKEFIEDNLWAYFPAKQKNIDTGMGVERTLAILNKFEDNYETEVFKPIIEKIELLSEHKYDEDEQVKKSMRIIADHIKAAIFIISDGVIPSNTEQGYVLRRLIRRAIRYGRVLGIERFTNKVADVVYPIYKDYNLDAEKINIELATEEERFLKTIDQGIRVFEKLAINKCEINGKNAFLLFQSYGFPIEMTIELAKEKNIRINKKDFEKELSKHQELSRTATKGKFKSGLADHSEQTTKLHTAAHLVHQALRDVLKEPVEQKGSNINAERLRFDFSFDRKLTDEEISQVERIVNEKINESIQVTMKEMTVPEAKKYGAIGIFDDKYGEKVKVYTIGDFSKEICSGPHVENTKELGHFKITKQESVSAGVRRIKAILE